MSTLSPQTEQMMRQGFKYLNHFMMLMWRLGLGGWLSLWPEVGGQIMVLAHTGRKTGLRRCTPVNFAYVEGELYCTAGFGSIADWYQNILAHPNIEVWLPDGRWAATAEDVSDHPDRLLLLRETLKGSGIVAPLVGVDPHRLDDAELDRLTAKYRLIHIRRLHPLTGEGGPGDLAWVWPAAVFALALLISRRRKRR